MLDDGCGLFSEDGTVEAVGCGFPIVEDEFTAEDTPSDALFCTVDVKAVDDDIMLFSVVEKLPEFSEFKFVCALEPQAVNVISVKNARKSAVSFLIFMMISSLSVLLFFFN